MTTFYLPNATFGKTYHAEVDVGVTSGDFDDCVIRLMVKRRATDADEAALISIDNDELGGITVTDGTVLEIDITDDVMGAAGILAVVNKRLHVGISVETPDGETHPVADLSPEFIVESHAVHTYAQ